MQLLTVASRLDWAGWLRGLVGAFVSGGAAAIGGGTGVSLVDPDHFNVSHPGHLIEVMGIAFLTSAVISLGKYLQTHPIPDVKS